MESGEMEIGKNSSFTLQNVANVQFLNVLEFIYDTAKGTKKQCYDDDDDVGNEYEICLELRENENEMILYLESSDNLISFEDDDEWNEVHRIQTINDSETNSQKIKKCLNLYQYERKICLIKHEEKNEYRVTIRKHEKP